MIHVRESALVGEANEACDTNDAYAVRHIAALVMRNTSGVQLPLGTTYQCLWSWLRLQWRDCCDGRLHFCITWKHSVKTQEEIV